MLQDGIGEANGAVQPPPGPRCGERTERVGEPEPERCEHAWSGARGDTTRLYFLIRGSIKYDTESRHEDHANLYGFTAYDTMVRLTRYGMGNPTHMDTSHFYPIR